MMEINGSRRFTQIRTQTKTQIRKHIATDFIYT